MELRSPTRSILALAMLAAVLVNVGCGSSSLLRLARETTRNTGTEAGKVLAIIPSDGLTADVLLYSNLIEARVRCLNLSDFDRVADKLSLGDSIAIMGASPGGGAGACTPVSSWWRVARSPKADAIVGARHRIAVGFFGVFFPDSMARFIGEGETYLNHSQLERIAAKTPDALAAFDSWGIDVEAFSEFSDRITTCEADRATLTRQVESLRRNDPVGAFSEGAGLRCVEAMRGVATHLLTLGDVVLHVSRASGGEGHHPGLENAVDGIGVLVEPFIEEPR